MCLMRGEELMGGGSEGGDELMVWVGRKESMYGNV